MTVPGAASRALRAAFTALAALALAGATCQKPERPPLPPRAQAQALIDSGDPAQALAILERLRLESPSDLDLARLYAEASVRAGRGAELVAKLEKARPTAANEYMRALVLFAQAQDATPDAVAAMQRALALAPDSAELHYRLGLMLLESEKYAASLAPLSRAAELSPDRGGYLLPLAKAKARTGDAAGAVAALHKLVDLGPTPAEVKTAHELMESISDPFAGIPKAAQPKLDDAIAWLHTYDVPQQAIVQLEEILRDYPDLALVHALLGLAYQRLDDAGRAVDELRRAIELAPAHGKFHQYLGELYLSRQRPDQARAELEKAVQLDPLLDEAYSELGDIAFHENDLEAAKRSYRTLTFLLPDAVGPRGKLALVLQAQGDFAGAQRELRSALDKEPDNVDLQLRLGVLEADRARDPAAPRAERDRAAQEAEKWLRKVLEAQPDTAVASRALESLQAR